MSTLKTTTVWILTMALAVPLATGAWAKTTRSQSQTQSMDEPSKASYQVQPGDFDRRNEDHKVIYNAPRGQIISSKPSTAPEAGSTRRMVIHGAGAMQTGKANMTKMTTTHERTKPLSTTPETHKSMRSSTGHRPTVMHQGTPGLKAPGSMSTGASPTSPMSTGASQSGGGDK